MSAAVERRKGGSPGCPDPPRRSQTCRAGASFHIRRDKPDRRVVSQMLGNTSQVSGCEFATLGDSKVVLWQPVLPEHLGSARTQALQQDSRPTVDVGHGRSRTSGSPRAVEIGLETFVRTRPSAAQSTTELAREGAAPISRARRRVASIRPFRNRPSRHSFWSRRPERRPDRSQSRWSRAARRTPCR